MIEKMRVTKLSLATAIVAVGVFGLTISAEAAPKPPVVSLPVLSDVEGPKPNIVHILTDDLGWMDPACYYRDVRGKESIYETPNMDKLAKGGMRFMQAYSPAPVCAPSRAAYLSGQYGAHNGILHVMGGRLARPYHTIHAYGEPFYPSRIPIATPTIPRLLKEAGYVTGHIQKLHVGGRSNGYPGPLAYGFDFGWQGGPGTPYNDPELWDTSDPKRADFNGIWTPLRPDRVSNFPSSHDPKARWSLDEDDRPFDSVVDLSVRWMEKIKDKPFFLNFCPSFVHGPFSTRDRKRLEYYCEKMGVPFPTDPGLIAEGMPPRQANPYYAAMLDSLDWQIGKLLTFLETTDDPRNPGHKLIDNTYVILSSDNGGLAQSPVAHGKGKGQRERITDNTPLRGGKLEVYEGGLRIPFIVQGPDVEAGSKNDTPINLIDMFPTFMAMAGIRGQKVEHRNGNREETTLDLDGCNVLPLMLGKDNKARFVDGRARASIFFHYPSPLPSSSVIRKGGWKLLLYHGVGMDPTRPEIQLFKLYNDDGSLNDLGESTNLAHKNPEKLEELLKELKTWLAKYDAPLPYRNPRTPGRTHPHNDRVPEVTGRSIHGNRIQMSFETGVDKAKIVEAKLIYTTNGSEFLRDHAGYEEWLEAPASLGNGIASAIAPPGMTHGVFYLRDENNYQVNSEWIPPYDGPTGKAGIGAELLEDGYAYRPGLLSLIKTAVSAETSARKAGQNSSALAMEIKVARAIVKTPVEERSYAVSMRNLRYQIRSLDVPQAKLPVLNQFTTKRWSGPERENASARGENPPNESASRAFDGDPKTKWLDFSPQGSWIQYDCRAPMAMSSYVITSAGESPERDPKDWQLLGSNDGKNWKTLDSRKAELWTKRQEMRSFTVSNKTAYRFYRLNIAAVRDVKNADSVQIGEIEFFKYENN